MIRFFALIYIIFLHKKSRLQQQQQQQKGNNRYMIKRRRKRSKRKEEDEIKKYEINQKFNINRMTLKPTDLPLHLIN